MGGGVNNKLRLWLWLRVKNIVFGLVFEVRFGLGLRVGLQ